MQEQIQESLLETKQARQMLQALSVRVATLEPKADSVPITDVTNPLFVPAPVNQRHHCFHTPIKMEVPCFDGTEPLGWIFKSTSFPIFIIPRMINVCPLQPFTWMVQY